MENPLVSVIIPVYKVEKYLEKCVKSVLSQTYQNLEVILVDDGSPDECPRLCDEYELKDHRVRTIHKPNGGLSDARNIGMKSSTGEYLLFVDSDDWIENNLVEMAIHAMSEYRVDIVSFSANIIENDVIVRHEFMPYSETVGVVANTSAIAVFGIVTTIEGYVYLITSAINGMFMPRISKIYADKQEKKLLPLMIKVGRFQFALNGLIVVGFFVVGRQFVNLWMGPNYDDAYLGILLVIVPGLLYNSLQIANTAMTVRNKVHLSAIVALVAGVINVSLSLVLSKYFGVTGACISIFVAYMVRAILMIWLHDKKMNINIGQFIKACYLKMSVPIIVTAIAGSLLSKLFNQWNWISICVCGIGVILIYSVSILLFGLDKEEKGYFSHLFNR